MKCFSVLFQFYLCLICVYCTPIASETKNNINTNYNNVTNNSTLITDNLSSVHRSQQPEKDNSEWEILYDKEIGTWCQPDDVISQSTTALEPINRELQRMSPVVNTGTSTVESHVLTRWVDAALRLVRTLQLNCTDSMCSLLSADEEDGQQSTMVNSRPTASDMNLYVATVDGQNQKLVAVLADGGLSKTGAHDAWLVLDPTPQLAFGHTLYVFVVDFNTSDVNCIAAGGVPLGNFTAQFF